MRMNTFISRALVFTTFAFVTLLHSIADESSDLAQRLQVQLKGQVLLIRGFYQNGTLNYTAQGDAIGHPKPGAWTLAKMQIQEIKVSNDAFELRGPRVAAVMDYKKGEFVNVLPVHKDSIKIIVHAPAATTDAQKLDYLIHKIFIVDQKPQASLFPPYWQDFFTGRSSKIHGKDGKFIFKADSSDFATKTKDSAPLTLATGLGSSAKPMPTNTLPPRIVRQVDPDYSELARASGAAGTVLVSIEVDQAGQPRNPQIVAPIGFGLDDCAVEAVQRWQFVPAKRDGNPVSVLVVVEINFRIY
jgi:TonB family protein